MCSIAGPGRRRSRRHRIRTQLDEIGQMDGQHVVWTEPGLPFGDAIRPVTDAAGTPPPTVAVTVRVCVVTLDLGRLQPGEGTGQHTVPVV